MRSCVGACAACLIAGSAPASVVQFLATDGNRLYRGDLAGNVSPYVTLSAAVQSLTRVPYGFSINGASGGDIIATAADSTGGAWKVYRVDDPFGAATLTQIGATSFGVGSIAFGPDGMYAINDALSPMRVSKLDSSNFSTVQNYSTGISVTGGGGIAYDPAAAKFYLTDYTNNRLLAWNPGNNATVVGNVGFGFLNNGLEFLNGTLYGALRQDSPNSVMQVGTFNTATGAFTGTTIVNGILGNGTGFVTIPGPAGAVVLVLASASAARRRRGA